MAGAKPIEGFPNYEIYPDGTVRTIKNQAVRSTSVASNGSLKITLYKNNISHTRSLALLVAKAHLWNDWDPEVFDTPIHLDHDMTNVHVDNLAWRPRWFAIKYNKQYWYENYRYSKTSVYDPQTDELFESIADVCQRYGVLFIDVFQSCNNGKTVFPTTKSFEFG